MRTFLAVSFSEIEKEKICSIQNKLKCSSENEIIIPKNNLHMTLAFLGEKSQEDVKKCKQVTEKIKTRGFIMKLNRAESFHSGNSYLYYLAPDDCERINELAHDVQTLLTYKSIEFDKKPFVPHVTLIKKADKPICEKISPISIRVCSVNLFCSDLSGNFPAYTSLYEKTLGK